MKHLLTVILSLICVVASKAQQRRTIFDVGVVMEISAYQWHQRPYQSMFPPIEPFNYRSTGQALSFTNLGLELVLGSPKHNFYWLGRGTVLFAPLSFDVANYNGLGSVAFPVTTGFMKGWRAQKYDEQLGRKKRGADYFVTFCGGVQWLRQDLYARPLVQTPHNIAPANDFFMTYIGELSLGQGGANAGFSFFVRAGAAARGALTFNVGFRASMGLIGLFGK